MSFIFGVIGVIMQSAALGVLAAMVIYSYGGF